MPERQIIKPRGFDLPGRNDHVVRIRLARYRDGAVDHADPPGGPVRGYVEAGQRTLRRPLGLEHAAVDGSVEGRQLDLWTLGSEQDDPVAVGRLAGQPREVVGPVDRGTVVHIVSARDDDRTDRSIGQALELARDAFHRSARLRVRVEEIASDQEQIDLLRQGQIDRRTEGIELTLSLSGGLLAHVGVASAKVDICGVQESKHPRAHLPCRRLASCPDRNAVDGDPVLGPPPVRRERGAPMPSLADPRFGPHCDRLSGTTASFCADVELRRVSPRGPQGGASEAVMTAQGPS